MVKGEGLTVFGEKMKAAGPRQELNEVYKPQGCEQAEKIVVNCATRKRVKDKIRRRQDHLVAQQLNDQNIMKAINCKVVPVAGYVCNLGEGELDELGKIVKGVLRREAWKTLKKKLNEGQKMNKAKRFEEKVLKSEIPSKYEKKQNLSG